jgi:hypothetical protein
MYELLHFILNPAPDLQFILTFPPEALAAQVGLAYPAAVIITLPLNFYSTSTLVLKGAVFQTLRGTGKAAAPCSKVTAGSQYILRWLPVHIDRNHFWGKSLYI